MRVHTVTIIDRNGAEPSKRLDELSTETLHTMIAHKHEIVIGVDHDGTITVDEFIDQARIILSLREQGAPI